MTDDALTRMYAEVMVQANLDVYNYPGDVDEMLESPELARLHAIEDEANALGILGPALQLRKQLEREAS